MRAISAVRPRRCSLNALCPCIRDAFVGLSFLIPSAVHRFGRTLQPNSMRFRLSSIQQPLGVRKVYDRACCNSPLRLPREASRDSKPATGASQPIGSRTALE